MTRKATTLEKELRARQRVGRVRKVANIQNLDRLTWFIVQAAAIAILIMFVLAVVR